jgi:hypothetical protein
VMGADDGEGDQSARRERSQGAPERERQAGSSEVHPLPLDRAVAGFNS